MKMEAYEAYKVYLAIRNHFSIDKYDYFKYNKKVTASHDSFLKRRDKIFFARLGKKDDTLEDFLVANLSEKPKTWVGELLTEPSEEKYKDWKRKQESLSYVFKNEMSFIDGWNAKELNEWFDAKDDQHPNIIRMYLRSEISLETLAILNSIIQFTKQYDKKITDPIYKEVSQRCKKYQPFLKCDLQKMKRILREMVIA